jgi:predicted transcriptional regulator
MAATVIDWDGNSLPPELEALPPGRYLLVPADSEDEEMTREEDAAVREGLDDARDGRVVTLAQVRRELKSIKRRA